MSEKFTVVKKGYDMSEVDKYVETLEGVVKSYKEKDSAIKNAILNAQIAADNIIKNAELQANAIEHDAIVRLEDISQSVSTQKQILKNFEDEYKSLMHKYLLDIDKNEIAQLSKSLTKLDEFVTKLKKSPESSKEAGK